MDGAQPVATSLTIHHRNGSPRSSSDLSPDLFGRLSVDMVVIGMCRASVHKKAILKFVLLLKRCFRSSAHLLVAANGNWPVKPFGQELGFSLEPLPVRVNPLIRV